MRLPTTTGFKCQVVWCSESNCHHCRYQNRLYEHHLSSHRVYPGYPVRSAQAHSHPHRHLSLKTPCAAFGLWQSLWSSHQLKGQTISFSDQFCYGTAAVKLTDWWCQARLSMCSGRGYGGPCWQRQRYYLACDGYRWGRDGEVWTSLSGVVIIFPLF